MRTDCCDIVQMYTYLNSRICKYVVMRVSIVNKWSMRFFLWGRKVFMFVKFVKIPLMWTGFFSQFPHFAPSAWGSGLNLFKKSGAPFILSSEVHIGCRYERRSRCPVPITTYIGTLKCNESSYKKSGSCVQVRRCLHGVFCQNNRKPSHFIRSNLARVGTDCWVHSDSNLRCQPWCRGLRDQHLSS